MVSPRINTRVSGFQSTVLAQLCIPSNACRCSLPSQMCTLREFTPWLDSQLPSRGLLRGFDALAHLFAWMQSQFCLFEQDSRFRLQLRTPCCWCSPPASVTTCGVPSSALSSQTTHPAHQRPWPPQKAAAVEGASSFWLHLPEDPYFHLYKMALLSASAHTAVLWMDCTPSQALKSLCKCLSSLTSCTRKASCLGEWLAGKIS